MKKLKTVLISVLIITVIVIIILLLLQNKEKNSNFNEEQNSEPESSVEKLEKLNDYCLVKDCINLFLGYNTTSNTEALYSLLNREYINENNINENNVINKINIIKEENFLEIKDIYQNFIQGESYFVYLVQAKVIAKNNPINTQDLYIKLNLDYSNLTFAIDIIDKTKFNDIIKNKKNSKTTKISKNDYNIFSYKIMNDDEMVKEYINNYQQIMIYDPEYAYQFLDDGYKEKRFDNSIDNFKQYIQNNITKIQEFDLTQFKINRQTNYTEYIGEDENFNYYNIKATKLLEYKVKLDNYTIPEESFVKDYSNSSDQIKVATNVDMFIKMINNKDYKSAYNVLSNEFKNNYFKTQEDFENYVKNTFFNYNFLSAKEIKLEGSVYLYTIEIASGFNKAASIIEKTFIIKLGEGTNFELSFNIE